MAKMNGSSSFKLSVDNVDDLVYACRTNDLDELRQSVSQLASHHSASEANIISSAVDVDEDGLGSRACLLHYPAANGNLEMVNYLLEVLKAQSPETPSTNGVNGHERVVIRLTNHQNVSGNTPLHWAALNGHLEVVHALVRHGADPTIVNGAGRDAVVEAEYSSKENATECATWLLKECEVLENGTGAGQYGNGTVLKNSDETEIDNTNDGEKGIATPEAQS